MGGMGTKQVWQPILFSEPMTLELSLSLRTSEFLRVVVKGDEAAPYPLSLVGANGALGCPYPRVAHEDPQL
jgi:hypothetical protein